MAIGRKRSSPSMRKVFNTRRKRNTELKGNDIIKDKIRKKSPKQNISPYKNGSRKKRSIRYSFHPNNNSYKNITTPGKKKILYMGTTSEDEGHTHRFILYSDYSISIQEAVHPKSSAIRHHHNYTGKYSSGQVTVNSSNCYPRCEDLYGYDGAKPHGHTLIFEDEIKLNLGQKNTIKSKIETVRKNDANQVATILQKINQEATVLGIKIDKDDIYCESKISNCQRFNEDNKHFKQIKHIFSNRNGIDLENKKVLIAALSIIREKKYQIYSNISRYSVLTIKDVESYLRHNDDTNAPHMRILAIWMIGIGLTCAGNHEYCKKL